MAKLNVEQREAVDTIICAVEEYTQTSPTTQVQCFIY